MLLYLILTAVTIALTTLVRVEARPHTRQAHVNRTVLCALFLALFFVSALRVRTGNDYLWYVDIMHEASVGGVVPTETGFNLIVRAVFALFGYEQSAVVFALMSFITVFFFLAAIMKLSGDVFMSYAMFLLLGYYFQSFSTVRYYAVLAVALFSIWYLDRGDYIRFALIILACALIHKSVLAVLVLYPLARMRWNRYLVAAGALVSAGVLFFPDAVLSLALRLYPTYQNVEDMGDTGLNLYNVARCVLVLLFVLWFAREDLFGTEETVSLRRMRLYTKMTVIALVLYVAGMHLPQVSRIAFYLTLPQIFLVPSVLARIEDERLKRFARGVVLALCAVVFIRYLRHAADDGIRTLPYRTFLFDE